MAELGLMAVHAHPDDESTSTGGILARYALEGVRTIVVTCTNGELGDGPGGLKPGEDGHDTGQVAAIRLGELRNACRHLGVAHLELLGYHDSGMADWDHWHSPDAFCNVPLKVVAARIAGLIEHYRPQVVVSYDPNATYQHPDHIHAARAAAMAVRISRIPDKLYAKSHGATYWRQLREALAEIGIHRPSQDPDRLEHIERAITTAIDVSSHIERKRAALHAHASQRASSLAAQLPANLFAHAFGIETYTLCHNNTDSASFESDLFSGLRTKRR